MKDRLTHKKERMAVNCVDYFINGWLANLAVTYLSNGIPSLFDLMMRFKEKN